MNWVSWLIVVLAFIEGGWLAFDGTHALVCGDYVTPRAGRFEGQLGPWSKLVSTVGIQPRSTLMKTIHVVIGFSWLIVIVCFVLQYDWAWWGMLACAVAAFWYLPFGTLLSVVQIAMLVFVRKQIP